MSYRLLLTDAAKEDYEFHKKSGDKVVKKKLLKLLQELKEHPETGTGKVERLKYQNSGLWSRRITQEHRIIYEINQEDRIVTIHYMKDHYR